MTTCVFCGKPIEPDEPTAGRPPMAAHAACADAALADDAHWDRVAAAAPEQETDDPEPRQPERDARAGGCLAILVATAMCTVTAIVLFA